MSKSKKVFIVRDVVTESTRLVRADTRGQVSRYLASKIVIEQADPMDVYDLVNGSGVTMEDATAMGAGPAEGDAGEDAGAPAGDGEGAPADE